MLNEKIEFEKLRNVNLSNPISNFSEIVSIKIASKI